MSVIDDLVREVDVDGALAQVHDAHERAHRRRRRGRAAAVAVAVALAGVATAAVWRTTGRDQSLDVVGGTSGKKTPAAATVQAGDGLVLTMSVDDDHVAIGDTVRVELKVTNHGAATVSGVWGVQHDCGGSIGFAVRDRDSTGGVASIGNLSSGDNAWFAPGDGLKDAIARQVDGSARSAVGAVPSVVEGDLLLAHHCAAGPSVEQLAPGQTASRTAIWPVWIGPGDLGGDGSFQIDGIVDAVACSGCTDNSFMPTSVTPGCEMCALFTLGQVSLPIWVDPASRTAPPTAEQLTDALSDDHVQQLLDSFGPRMNGSTELGFGGWLLQIGDAWLQRIQGERGAVDIWFDTTGTVAEVQTKTGNDPVAPPTKDDTCGLGEQDSNGPSVPSANDMAALDDPDALIGLDEEGLIVGYFRQGDLKPTQQEMESGDVDPLVGLVDKCGNHTGWMSRDGAFFFTDAEIEAPGFDLDRAVAEKRAAQGTTPGAPRNVVGLYDDESGQKCLDFTPSSRRYTTCGLNPGTSIWKLENRYYLVAANMIEVGGETIVGGPGTAVLVDATDRPELLAWGPGSCATPDLADAVSNMQPFDGGSGESGYPFLVVMCSPTSALVSAPAAPIQDVHLEQVDGTWTATP